MSRERLPPAMLVPARMGTRVFVASSGNVTNEVIMEYIATQDLDKPDDSFRVDG